MLEQLKEQWDNILLHVKEEHDIMDVSFNTWLLPLKIFAVDGNVVKILAPDAQMLRYIQKKYGLILQVSIEEVTGFACTLDFITEDDVKEKEKPEKMLIQNTPGDVSQTALQNANLNPRYTFDTFVVGANNNLAHAAALAVAESPGEVYNPLFIYGGVGLGKTHLMHSIAHFILKNNPEAKILYVTSEKFTNELIDAIRNKNNISTTEFREKYRNNDVLLIDDIQFIIGKESTQEEFFHTFNTLYEAKKQIIISSDKPPREIARLEERLRSRFEWGLIADIQKPDFDTRIAILRKKAENEGIEISDEMLELIAGRIESNIRELEGSLTRVNAYAKLNHCEINEEVISHALHDIAVVRDPKRITPELIIDCVADYYSLSADMLRGDSRKKEIALARHVAVYLTREMTGLSLPRIGDAFGRDHSTIINSCDKVTKMLDTSSDMKSSIADLKKIITEK